MSNPFDDVDGNIVAYIASFLRIRDRVALSRSDKRMNTIIRQLLPIRASDCPHCHNCMYCCKERCCTRLNTCKCRILDYASCCGTMSPARYVASPYTNCEIIEDAIITRHVDHIRYVLDRAANDTRFSIRGIGLIDAFGKINAMMSILNATFACVDDATNIIINHMVINTFAHLAHAPLKYTIRSHINDHAVVEMKRQIAKIQSRDYFEIWMETIHKCMNRTNIDLCEMLIDLCIKRLLKIRSRDNWNYELAVAYIGPVKLRHMLIARCGDTSVIDKMQKFWLWINAVKTMMPSVIANLLSSDNVITKAKIILVITDAHILSAEAAYNFAKHRGITLRRRDDVLSRMRIVSSERKAMLIDLAATARTKKIFSRTREPRCYLRARLRKIG